MFRKIPRCMSTQHPDNVITPFFSENSEIGGEDEIQEAYYVFSHLGCDEQMWDFEGKEVDNYVVKKLLTKYEDFFRENIIGKDVFITLRVPNPSVEKSEAKILLETLESIPRSFDVAKIFYSNNVTPIFEVILPMTSSSDCLNRIYYYYKNFVSGKEKLCIRENDVKICDWIGEFFPKEINVIPLYENMEQMLNSHIITEEYLKDKNFPSQRVFLARSDPAMNYGLISAVILNKIALKRLDLLSKKVGIKIYPIVGVGSSPFRGNLKPTNVDNVLKEYPSVYTFTIQSAFKYDYPPEEVRWAIKKIKERVVKEPDDIDEERALEIMRKYLKEYQRQIVELAPLINFLTKFVPSRRKRKLHIGLFGYSRDEMGVKLPRAIPFVASLYSIGLPPEILGLNILTKEDINFIKKFYLNFEKDLSDSLKYINLDSPFIQKEIKEKLKELEIDFEVDLNHKELTDLIINSIKNNKIFGIDELILKASSIRRFLG